ncbi:2-dehydropantoate 2-reductase (Ketopantoate reductase) (KPA reductase) (KPR) [Coemansia spiralis]|nr:2-dehydropantoate 2-reductase (Ketopantoate reductase) (KPA reductase) (KPR) [Coemansia spiralis]
MVQVHVLGAGALGLLFAAHLRRAGHPVTVLLRSPAAVDRFLRAGARIEVAGGRTHEAPLIADGIQAEASSGGVAGAIRHLLVATKAQDTLEAFAAVRHRLSPKATVVLLQNGMGVLDAIRDKLYTPPTASPAVAPPTFVVGTTSHGCYRVPDNAFSTHHAAMGAFLFAVHPPLPGAPAVPPETATAMADALRGLPLAATEASWPDVHVQLLLKLAVNAVINPTTALTGCRNGRIWPHPPPAGDPAAGGYLPLACAEIAAIYDRAFPHLRSTLSAAAIEEHVTRIIRDTARNYSSMQQDVAAGRPTEIEWINGHLARLGERHGVPTPVNTLLCALVRLRTATTDDQPE